MTIWHNGNEIDETETAGPGVALTIAFSQEGEGSIEGGQHGTPKFITIFFCDISLISISSSRLVSRSLYLRILLS